MSPILLFILYFVTSPLPGTDKRAGAAGGVEERHPVKSFFLNLNGAQTVNASSASTTATTTQATRPREATTPPQNEKDGGVPVPAKRVEKPESPSLASDSKSSQFIVPSLPNPLCPASPLPQAAGHEAHSVPVLLYHGEAGGAGNTPTDVFIDQMCTLKRAGWNTITLGQFLDFLKNGKPIPDKSFLLTFDDGRRDTYYPADPIIKELGFSAVMFTITGFSLPGENLPPISEFYLSKAELDEMDKSGRWEIQSHGKEDHRIYQIPTTTSAGVATTLGGHFMSNLFQVEGQNRLEAESEFSARITNDLTEAKQVLEKAFGKPVIAYAFPFNDLGQNTINFPGSRALIRQVASSIYPLNFYQNWAGEGDSFNYPEPNNTMVRRIDPGTDWSGERLLLELDAGRAKELPYQSTAFGNEWREVWGNVAPAGSSLRMSARPGTTGASTLLNGSGFWKDYVTSIRMDWKGGSDISLLARASDSYNSVACTFSESEVTIEKRIAGKRQNLTSRAYAFTGPKTDALFSIEVVGNTVRCSVGGIEVANATIPDAEVRGGGVGIQIWDPAPGKAEIAVTDIDVERR